MGAQSLRQSDNTFCLCFFWRSFAQFLKGILALCFDISTAIEDSEDEEQGSLCWLGVGKDEVQQGKRPSQLLAYAASPKNKAFSLHLPCLFRRHLLTSFEIKVLEVHSVVRMCSNQHHAPGI